MNNQHHFPIEVAFHNLDHSNAIEANARTHAEKLGTYFDHILNCNVTIETHHHQHKGNIYHVSINLGVPNAELIANRDPSENHAHEDVYVAIRDAFDAIKRQLKEYKAKRRGEIKSHVPQLQGSVLEIAPMGDFGLIETKDGRVFRFSKNSVIDYDFNQLEIGDKVRFIEAESNDGAAASTVYIV